VPDAALQLESESELVALSVALAFDWACSAAISVCMKF
jgi:hypothetical protein